MTEFTPLASLFGGALIGLAAVLLMATSGQVAGISGILDGAIERRDGDGAWRYWFLGGLVAGPLLYAGATGALPPISMTDSVLSLLGGGVLVGVGTRLSGGCTSGHGICGMALLSTRSIIAVLVFMAVAFVTVFLTRHPVWS
jgi:uncharacterized membrane protein YedE/YeeE